MLNKPEHSVAATAESDELLNKSKGKDKDKGKDERRRPEGETVMALRASGELVPVDARGGVLRTTPSPMPEVSALAAHQVRLVGIDSQDSFWLVDSGATSHCIILSFQGTDRNSRPRQTRMLRPDHLFPHDLSNQHHQDLSRNVEELQERGLSSRMSSRSGIGELVRQVSSSMGLPEGQKTGGGGYAARAALCPAEKRCSAWAQLQQSSCTVEEGWPQPA
eukprot:s3278_g1.t5